MPNTPKLMPGTRVRIFEHPKLAAPLDAYVVVEDDQGVHVVLANAADNEQYIVVRGFDRFTVI